MTNLSRRGRSKLPTLGFLCDQAHKLPSLSLDNDVHHPIDFSLPLLLKEFDLKNYYLSVRDFFLYGRCKVLT